MYNMTLSSIVFITFYGDPRFWTIFFFTLVYNILGYIEGRIRLPA